MIKKLLLSMSLLLSLSAACFAGTGGGFDFYNYLKNPANKALDMNGFSINTSSDIRGIRQITWWDGSISTSATSGGIDPSQPVVFNSSVTANGPVRFPSGAGANLVWTSDINGYGHWDVAISSATDLRPFNNIWTGTNAYSGKVTFSSTVAMTDGIMLLGDTFPPEVAPLFEPQRGGLTTYGTSDTKYPFLTANSGAAASIVVANYGDKVGFQNGPMEYHLRVGTFTFTSPFVFNNTGVLSIWGVQGSSPTAVHISQAFLSDTPDNPLAVVKFEGTRLPPDIPVLQILSSSTSPSIQLLDNSSPRSVTIGFTDDLGIGQSYPHINLTENETFVLSSSKQKAQLMIIPVNSSSDDTTGSLGMMGYDGLGPWSNTYSMFEIKTHKDRTDISNINVSTSVTIPINFITNTRFLNGSYPTPLEEIFADSYGPLLTYNSDPNKYGAMFVQQTEPGGSDQPALMGISYGDRTGNNGPVLGVLRLSTLNNSLPKEVFSNEGNVISWGAVSSSATMRLDGMINTNSVTNTNIMQLTGTNLKVSSGATAVLDIVTSTDTPFINMQLANSGYGFDFTTFNFWGLAPDYMPTIRSLGASTMIFTSTMNSCSIGVTPGDLTATNAAARVNIVGWGGGVPSPSTLATFILENNNGSNGDIYYSKLGTWTPAGAIRFLINNLDLNGNSLINVSSISVANVYGDLTMHNKITFADRVDGRFPLQSSYYGIYIGYNSGNPNINTYGNTAVGVNTLSSLNQGTGNNTALGATCLETLIGGSGNTAIGKDALLNNVMGSNNVSIGYGSLASSWGSNNVAVGYQTGQMGSNSSGNVFLGSRAGYNELGSNKLYISNSQTTAPLIYGEFDTGLLQFSSNTISFQNGTVTASAVNVSSVNFTDGSTLTSGVSSIQTPSLVNNWSNQGAGMAHAGYFKVGPIVYLQGTIAGGSTGSGVVFTLPVGYRPIGARVFVVATNAPSGPGVTSCEIVITDAGTVICWNANTASLCLDGISFNTAGEE